MPRLPIDYSNAFIYKLSCKDKSITEVYIGSTTHFINRKYTHKSSCINSNNKDYNTQKYIFIRANGGWENWEMIEIEKFSCNNKRELEKREEELRCQFEAKLNSNPCWSNGLCKIDGCENQRIKDGVCIKHGAITLRCKIDGCENQRIKDGVCVKHGAIAPRCKIDGCENQQQKDGVCIKHGAITPRCKIDGCENKQQKDGVCIKHGAIIIRPRCKMDGCKNQYQKNGLCIKHKNSLI
jgi:hypothetical protein